MRKNDKELIEELDVVNAEIKGKENTRQEEFTKLEKRLKNELKDLETHLRSKLSGIRINGEKDAQKLLNDINKEIKSRDKNIMENYKKIFEKKRKEILKKIINEIQ
ncbi:hypothetical protein J7L48_06940 [bacterium]|nr:hypothetical protein [bacterium]